MVLTWARGHQPGHDIWDPPVPKKGSIGVPGAGVIILQAEWTPGECFVVEEGIRNRPIQPGEIVYRRRPSSLPHSCARL